MSNEVVFAFPGGLIYRISSITQSRHISRGPKAAMAAKLSKTQDKQQDTVFDVFMMQIQILFKN